MAAPAAAAPARCPATAPGALCAFAPAPVPAGDQVGAGAGAAETGACAPAVTPMEPLAPAVAQGSPGEADRGGRPRAGPSPLPPVRSPTVTRGRAGARALGSTPEGARPRSRGRRALSAEEGALGARHAKSSKGGQDKENRPAPPAAPAACPAAPAAPACAAAGEGARCAAPASAGPRRRGAGVLVA